MSLIGICIARPKGTALIAAGLALAGLLAAFALPVAPLPRVAYPAILVQAALPGTNPVTAATALAAPLEHRLGKIADVREITSESYAGLTRVSVLFGLDRDIDGAARDVQAAINAARADLPPVLPSNPSYHKVNPAEPPVLVLALASPGHTMAQLYDIAATALQPRLARIPGVGLVEISGAAPPALRVALDPASLFRMGISLEDARAAIVAGSPNLPKGAIDDGVRYRQLVANDGLTTAAEFRDLVIGVRHGAPVRLRDVATVTDGLQDDRNQGVADGHPAVLLSLYRQPGANVIGTVDRVRALLPRLSAAVPADIGVTVVSDSSTTIRAALRDGLRNLIFAALLVCAVLFAFLRAPGAVLVPLAAMAVSLLGTLGGLFLIGGGLDTLSILALTIGTGFVIDDAIVVLEKIACHVEQGMPPRRAALRGAREVAFTVIAMSAALAAVFLPMLVMGGIAGRLLREFAFTLTIAIAISLVASLTLTPMLAAHILRAPRRAAPPAWRAWLDRAYDSGLRRALRHPIAWLALLPSALALSAFLLLALPGGLLPIQDTGRLIGTIRADQSTAFPAMRAKLAGFAAILARDPAVAHVAGYTGGRQANAGTLLITLKPRRDRVAALDVIARLRPALDGVPGARLTLQPAQDLRTTGRASAAQYAYTLQAPSLSMLTHWMPLLRDQLRHDPALLDLTTDLEPHGLSADLTIDRGTASQFGVLPAQIDETLYDAFGQRQIATTYHPLNQYRVVMEVAPGFAGSPPALQRLYVGTAGAGAAFGGVVPPTGFLPGTPGTGVSSGARTPIARGLPLSSAPETMIPLAAMAGVEVHPSLLAVSRSGVFPSATLSFNLPPRGTVEAAVRAIDSAAARIGLPGTIARGLSGGEPITRQALPLILATIAVIYVVLGLLYEDWFDPLVVLSTLPSAGTGALLALWLAGENFTLVALVGLLLLIGIVQKNGIMLVDTARRLAAGGLGAAPAIRAAAQERLRPILMTSLAAGLGALPLLFDTGTGAELRRPLGIAIVGGLLVSQAVTLFTTPALYLWLARLRARKLPREAFA